MKISAEEREKVIAAMVVSAALPATQKAELGVGSGAWYAAMRQADSANYRMMYGTYYAAVMAAHARMAEGFFLIFADDDVDFVLRIAGMRMMAQESDPKVSPADLIRLDGIYRKFEQHSYM